MLAGNWSAMASLRKKVGSPYWFACFTRPDGIRTQRSTKTGDRRLATRLALEWESAVRRKITEVQARRVLSDICEEIHGTRLECPDLPTFAARWLSCKQAEAAPQTLLAY